MHASPARANDARLTRETWRHFVGAVLAFATSEVRVTAGLLFAALLGLLVAISGLNVLNSYVGRDFMTAIERRDHADFAYQALRYVVVFGFSTAAAVLFRFTEERFGLLWRGWLTGVLVRLYLTDRTYLRVSESGSLTNPDQRITEDVRTFVTMTLSLFLMVLNGTLTVLAFSGVLWSISRTLFLVGIAYAAAGSFLTVLLGRRLIALNYEQADREADFRAGLIEVRENAECIALHRRERQLERRLQDHLAAALGNMKRIIAVNRNLGFFTTGYNYLIQIIPALVVAPLFIRGEVEFGVITQSAMAFSHLLGAFSLVVTQFQTISSYGAVLARLSALAEGLQPARVEPSAIAIVEDGDRIAYENLTLVGTDGEVFVHDLTFTIPEGSRILVCSRAPAARGALVRATAGIWDEGQGTVRRPPLEQIVFLPERPYLPPGTLREMMGASDGSVPLDDEIAGALEALDAGDLLDRADGIDVEHDWERVLTLHDQQILALARVLVARPVFAFVDDLEHVIGVERLPVVLNAFIERGITCVALGDIDEPRAAYDAVLEIGEGGAWRVCEAYDEPGAPGARLGGPA